MWYKLLRFKQRIFSKYATNLRTTSQRSLKTQVCSFYNLNLIIFPLIDVISNIIDIIYNIIDTYERSKPEFFRLLQDMVVFRLVAYLLNMNLESYTKSHIYEFLYNSDTFLYQFLETGTSIRSRSTPKYLRFQPTLLIFPFQSLQVIFFTKKLNTFSIFLKLIYLQPGISNISYFKLWPIYSQFV